MDDTSKSERMFTQSELDEIIKERLGRANRKYDMVLEQNDKLTAELAEAKLALEKAEASLGELPKLKRDMLVAEVVAETKLPANLGSRLLGTSKEELLEDAKRLAADLGAVKPKEVVKPVPSGAGEPKKSGVDIVLETMARKRAERNKEN